MTLDQLNKLVSQGEGQYLEFKNRVPSPIRMARELVAFSNANGGILLIGIEDNGEIIGVKDIIEEKFALDETILKHIKGEIDLEFKTLPISNKRSVIALHVRVAKSKPVFVIESEGSRVREVATIRVADMAIDTSREMRRILRHENSPVDVKFNFGEKEELLLKHLDEHGKVTVEEFAMISGVPKKVASQTLVLLTKAKLLDIHPREGGKDLFTLKQVA